MNPSQIHFSTLLCVHDIRYYYLKVVPSMARRQRSAKPVFVITAVLMVVFLVNPKQKFKWYIGGLKKLKAT